MATLCANQFFIDHAFVWPFLLKTIEVGTNDSRDFLGVGGGDFWPNSLNRNRFQGDLALASGARGSFTELKCKSKTTGHQASNGASMLEVAADAFSSAGTCPSTVHFQIYGLLQLPLVQSLSMKSIQYQ